MNGGHLLEIHGGHVFASNLTCLDSGAVMSADTIEMSGKATLTAEDLNATGGSSVVSCGNFTMRDEAHFYAGTDGEPMAA